MAEPWEQDQVVGGQQQANATPWDSDAPVQQPQARAPVVPPALVNRMSDDQVPLDLSKPYSQRLAEWTARHLKEGDYAATALGTVATAAAGVIEAPFDFAAKAAKAVREGLTPQEETQAGVEGAMLASGINEPPTRLPGGLRVADPAVKAAADKAAAETLKAADDALSSAGLPPEKDNSHADLANVAAVAGAHSEYSSAGGKVGYLPSEEDFGAATKSITAFHGSPYRFDAFDLGKVGTGEGAQAFGHGIYVAENRSVAEEYRNRVAPQPVKMPDYVVSALKKLDNLGFDRPSDAMAEIRADANDGRDWKSRWDIRPEDAIQARVIDKYLGVPKRKTERTLYQVRINADRDQFLDFDVPPAQQSEGVRRAFEASGMDLSGTTSGEDAYRQLSTRLGSSRAASEALHKAGVPGIKYLDQRSREAGEGTRNYVVFSDKDVEITHENDEAVNFKLRRLYDEYGVHPAEAAADAKRDPTIASSLASSDKSDLPRAYDPWAEEPAAGGGGHGSSGGAGDPPPEGPQDRKPIFTYTQADRSTFRKSLDFIADEYKKTFQPDLVSDDALKADPLFAEYKSKAASEKDAIISRAEDEHQFWRRASDTDRLAYMDAVERGDLKGLPDDLRAKAERHRALLDHAAELEKEVGSKAGYVEDYFPHIWQNPDQARGFVNSKIAQLGPKWFQKERAFDLIRDGLDAGLRLKSTNPEDLVVDRLLASADMRERMHLLENLRERNLAVPAKEADSDLARNGWQPINAPNRDQWMIAPDVQPLWKNAVAARGFWSNEGMPGSAFRGWMALKNVWVPIKLALSAFHFLHVLHINWNEGFARSWTQMTKGGDLAGAFNSAAEGFYGSVQAAIPGVPHLGKEVRAAWKIPKEERTPDQQAAVSLMNEGGFVPELSEQLRINARHAFEDAIDKGDWIKVVPQGIRRTLEKIQAPLFQEWIPNLKAAAYMNDAQALLARRPDLLEDAAQRKVALRTIAKSIDNRFGEMFYGGLFWNRYVKDSGIGSFLSMGWNLGFAREFIGGPLQSVGRLVDRMVNKRPTKTESTIADAQNKLPFVMSYAATGMLINGLMTYAFTGQSPEGLDWFFSRVGGTNPDGSPRRVTNMFYLRELPMMLKHVEARGGNIISGAMDMLWNKTMFEPAKELLENRDYYGSDIWDENGPLYVQAWQAMKHVFGDQFNPISISGARRAYLSSGQWGEALLALMGFGPAPSYVARSATENRIEYLYKRHVAPSARPMVEGDKARGLYDIRNEVLRAKQNHDRAGVEEAGRKWIEAGGSRQALGNMILGIPGDVSMFRALPEADQQAIMQQATKDEQAKYKPFLKTNISARAAELVYQAQTLAQQGDMGAAETAKRQLQTLVRAAVQDGTITNAAAFRRSLTQQLIARRAPELSALLALPKKLRAQYGQELRTLH